MMHPPAGRRPETRPPPRDGGSMVRLEAGDARTLAALCDRHAGAMYSLAMRIAGEPDDAEAIVRGVFAAAWSEAGRRPGRQAPDGCWLLATTRVRAIDYTRAAGGPDDAAATAATTGNEASAGASTGDAATLRLPNPIRRQVAGGDGPEDASRLRVAHRRLPPLERLAIELAYFEGLTISQIGARLEQTPAAANARIRTGLFRLAGRAGGQRASELRYDTPPTRDLASLYALGALNASERAAFEAHVEVHRESVDEVLSLLPVTRCLAWVAPPHEPPSGLRDRIIEAVTGAPLPGAAKDAARESSRPLETGGSPDTPVSDDGPEPADASDAPEPRDTGADPEVGDGGALETASVAARSAPGTDTAASPTPPQRMQEPTPTMQQPIPTMQQPTSTMQQPTPTMQQPTSTAQQPPPAARQQGRRWGLLLLAAGSLAAAAGLGLFAARQANLTAALQENLDAANTQARIAELETAAAQRVADELRAGTRVLTAGDVQMLDLGGQPAAADARGRLFWSASEGGLLTVTGLPPVPPGRTYQLWLIPEASPTSAALLSVDTEGRAMASFTPPEGVSEPVPAAVTLEPAGGASTPGGEVYLLGRP